MGIQTGILARGGGKVNEKPAARPSRKRKGRALLQQTSHRAALFQDLAAKRRNLLLRKRGHRQESPNKSSFLILFVRLNDNHRFSLRTLRLCARRLRLWFQFTLFYNSQEKFIKREKQPSSNNCFAQRRQARKRNQISGNYSLLLTNRPAI